MFVYTWHSIYDLNMFQDWKTTRFVNRFPLTTECYVNVWVNLGLPDFFAKKVYMNGIWQVAQTSKQVDKLMWP